MNRSRASRAVMVTAALAVPTLVVGLLLPGVAVAKAPKPPKGVAGSCTSLTGNINSTVTISGCSPEAAVGATGGTFNFSSGAASGSSSVAWTDGVITTFSFGGKEESPMKGTKANKKFLCAPTDEIEFLLKGKVGKNPSGNTGISGSETGFAGKVKADVCVDDSGNVSLRTGVFTL
jgi:hypothetical protein